MHFVSVGCVPDGLLHGLCLFLAFGGYVPDRVIGREREREKEKEKKRKRETSSHVPYLLPVSTPNVRVPTHVCFTFMFQTAGLRDGEGVQRPAVGDSAGVLGGRERRRLCSQGLGCEGVCETTAVDYGIRLFLRSMILFIFVLRLFSCVENSVQPFR